MLRLGLLQQRQNCTKAFPDMKDFFEDGFFEFAKANSNYVSLERWNDSSAVGASADLPRSRAWCMDFFHRNGKFDEMISTIFDEQQNFRLLQEMVEKKKGSRGVVGIGLSDTRPAYVAHIAPGSPAATAGIKEGDFIIRLNDAPVMSAKKFALEIGAMEPGTQVTIVVRRTFEILSFRLGVTRVDALATE